jgi:glutamate-1-semialdehyde 2,1-aminomutase
MPIRNQPSSRALELSNRAKVIIPGGAHTYAKGDDQFPEGAPPFLVRGAGCHVWDLDGHEYIEYGMGLRAVTLGHAYKPVIEAVARQLQFGSNFGRPSPIEVECAEQFLRAVPTAEMVKFCKDGSSALDGAVKLARAHTGRDKIAICGDQPFFSTSDWFIGSTHMPGGIPRWVREQTLKFRYNNLDSVRALFQQHEGQIACLILEAARTEEPHNGFLQGLREICTQQGAVLVFDEMVTGFRWHRSGAQHVYGVTPDLSSFGKALGNGIAISALAGRRELMELGGSGNERERVFLLSTTHGAETHALAAAIATMKVYEDEPVTEHLERMGNLLRQGVQSHVSRLGLEGHFGLVGRGCCLLFDTKGADKMPSQPFRTLFLQEMIGQGVIAPSFIVSYSHQQADIEKTVEAAGQALEIYAKALEDGIGKFLQGRPVKPALRAFL